MSEKKTFYLTTTLPYVNAKPHLGHALEFVTADVIVRYNELVGKEVFFNTGTDEFGSKVYTKAVEEKKDPQAYVNEYAEKFRSLIKLLNLTSDINFIRTTEPHHKSAAQKFWQESKKSGHIYKKNYKVKYCVGCELEKTDSELEGGRCPIHPNLEIEIREEENYFFAFSKFGGRLLEMYDKNPDFVLPPYRLNEIRALIEKGLEDFSISRLKEKMPWGVPVPDDDDHVMYVWFDALVNYISAIGWPDDREKFDKWWPVVQFAGKDQVRQQAAMWQAMLMSVGLPPSEKIIIHGFINSGGQKMSKSLGNVIDPYDVIEAYGTDALRYALCRELSFFEDSDFTIERFKESYNANLANGIGNLVSRIMKLAGDHLLATVEIPKDTIPTEWKKLLDEYKTKEAADFVWAEIGNLDRFMQEEAPFKIIKEDKAKGIALIGEAVIRLYTIARMLSPYLPETSEKIKNLIKENKMPERPLFPRKE